MAMGGFICWAIALGVLAVGTLAALYVLRVGAALAIKRDREQHLRIVNEARRRAGKPPMTDADLPPEPAPERDELLEKFFGWMRGNNRGFEVEPAVVKDEVEAVRKPVAKPRAVVPVMAVEEVEEKSDAAKKRLVAMVLLEQAYRPLTQEKLQKLVEKAWGVEFVVGEGEEEWVTYVEVEVQGRIRGTGMIRCGGYMFLVNNWDSPYFDDSEKMAEQVKESRGRRALRECRAWRSADLLGEMGDLTREATYALLGKLAAELAGNTTLGVYMPEEHRFFPYDETLLRALLSEDPLGRLKASSFEWVPVMEKGDAELEAAIAEARARFGEFEEAFASRSITGSGKKSPYMVKAEFGEGDDAEHMWVEVTAIEGGKVLGFLRSSPVNLRGLVKDEAVTVKAADISDWIGMMNGVAIGNFTGPVIEKRLGGRLG